MDKTQSVDPVAGKTVAEILGEIVWLMTQDPVGREMKVSEIEALIMPAILLKKFHIKYIKSANGNLPAMVKIGESLTFAPAIYKVAGS